MKGDQCRLLFYDLQGKAIPEVKLNENFVICTWKVRVLNTGSVRIKTEIEYLFVRQQRR